MFRNIFVGLSILWVCTPSIAGVRPAWGRRQIKLPRERKSGERERERERERKRECVWEREREREIG